MKYVQISALVCLSLFIGLTACSTKAPTMGVKDGLFAVCTDDGDCISSQATNAAHKIAPIQAEGDPAIVMVDLENSIESIFGARVIAVEDNYLRAEFKSRILRTMDDAEFYYDEKANVIHVHCISRGEFFDIDDNRERIEEIRQIFSQE